MFRTSNRRGQNRYDTLQKTKIRKNGKLVLNPRQIKLIEETPILTLGEKIELFLVSLGNKLTTELYLNINYSWDEKQQKEIVDQRDLELIKKLLEQLPFIFFIDSLSKKNKLNGRLQEFKWFQVSVNKAVSTFMQSFPNDMTEFEEGVLYGFPLSAIRAFSGLIEAGHRKPTPASYYLAGVCSADFWEDEQLYYETWWKRLKKISPATIEEAENKFFGNS